MVEDSVGKRYKLERELGRGGMGVIYLAHDTRLDRPVALKFLGSLADGNEEFRRRFKREAQAAAKVSHPNIVSIYDIGTREGRAYIAMEYIEGADLSKYLRNKGRLEAREAVNIITQALSALDAVHAASVTHRDIKPENIVITKGGLVKVMDFGLAKSTGKRLTAANVVMGTPGFMAPEQAKGKEADARTDLYAMGLVLHELLTGKTVFTGGDVLRRQIEEIPPRPGELADGIPPALDGVVMKSIAKKPGDRYQSAKEMIAALRGCGKV
jgi:eukaryotic-like serine/threonine-protein kinase